MALFRALEAQRPARRRLVTDPFAAAFVRPRLRALVALARLPGAASAIAAIIDRRWPGARSSGVARTRTIDDLLTERLGRGCEQVVILGAGFDARAYRMKALAGEGAPTVFEVDQPSTSAQKRRVLARIRPELPATIRFVALDFDAADLATAMDAAGYDARRRTLFLWEGVTNYLTEAAVSATLRWCARAAPGSVLVFTFVDRAVLDEPAKFAGAEQVFEYLRAVGEEWTFGIAPPRLAAYLGEHGLDLERDLPASEYRAMYYGAAAAAMRGYEFYHLAVCVVRRREVTA